MLDGNDSVHGAIHGATPELRLLKGMNALLAHRAKGRVHYTQGARRMTIVRKRLIPPFGTTVIYEDCSSAVTGLYYMAGLHDPNDLHYSGYGYTGTLDKHGHEVLSPFEIGDLVFYGGGVPHHVAIIYAAGKVWSMGHEGGPVIADIDYRSDRSMVRRYF